MSKTAKYEEEAGRQSKIQPRAFVITRSGPTSRSSSYNTRTSYNVRNSISPGVYQQLSSSGITDFKGNREKEKREMQNLNERLASYIEKVHFLDAQVKKLEAENEALRNRKVEDLQPIRDAYENELAQARKVIDELSSTKGVAEAKLAGLQDEIASLRDLIITYENQNKDYRKKIESLGNQIGEYEGELHTLRLRVGSLEDENAKIRELLEKVQEHNRRLRADLDTETAAHIEADCLAQTKSEEAEFYRDLLDQLELLKPEPITIKGMDYADFWKSELSKCVREIQSVYDEKIDLIQQDCEAKYSAQINSLRAGNVKDGMQLQHSQEEVKKLRTQLQDKNGAYAELAAKFAALQAEREENGRLLAELERELEEQRLKYNHDITDLDNELRSVMLQLQNLMDAKMSLELEIACYKKLLEGEESRVGLRSLVEQAIGTQGKGASSLKEAIQQSTTSGSMTIQRSSKGAIGFATADQTGANIVVENTTSGARSKSQSLKGWRLQKSVNGRVTIEINLKDIELAAGQKFTVWAKGAKERATSEFEQITDHFTYGVGTCTWTLLDEAGNEKATLQAKFSGPKQKSGFGPSKNGHPSVKESSGSLTIQRSSKGALAISSIGHAGENIVLENTTSGARAKNQSLKGWHLIKTVNGRDTINVALKDIDLKAGQKFTLWAKGAKDKVEADNEQIADSLSFGVGSCIWKLVDETGSEKATLNAKFTA